MTSRPVLDMSMIEQHAELLRRRRRRNAKGGRLSRHEHIVMLELEMMTSMDKEARVRRKLWDRERSATVKKMGAELANARGGRFIERDEAIKIMEQAEFKVEKILDPWSGTEIPNSGGQKRGIGYFHDLMIEYEGKWRRLSRVDLANECATGSYNINGSNHSKEEWIERVRYGAVVTDDDWYVVDAISDH